MGYIRKAAALKTALAFAVDHSLGHQAAKRQLCAAHFPLPAPGRLLRFGS